MKLYKYIIGLALLVSSSSCDFLDEEAYEFITPDNFYKTEADANAALTAVYNNFNDDKGFRRYIWMGADFQVKRLMLMPVRLHVWRWIILPGLRQRTSAKISGRFLIPPFAGQTTCC